LALPGDVKVHTEVAQIVAECLVIAEGLIVPEVITEGLVIEGVVTPIPPIPGPPGEHPVASIGGEQERGKCLREK
jgi:hypothetical protein